MPSLFGGGAKTATQTAKSSTPGRGQKSGSVYLADDFSVDLSELDGVLSDNPSVESVAVFQMQVR